MVQPTPSQVSMTGQQGDGRIVGVGEWMLMMLVVGIPLIGFIMVLVWAFSNDGSVTKANYFKALLVWMLISFVLGILIFLVFGAAIMAAVQSQSSY